MSEFHNRVRKIWIGCLKTLPYLVLSAAIVCGDRLFKNWITLQMEQRKLGGGKTIPLLPGILHLTYMQNIGASFSILQGARWLLVAVSIACALLLIWLLASKRFHVVTKISFAFLLGGAVGNLYDRIVSGYVVDMFETEFVRFAVFNVADCFITAGGALLFLCVLISTLREKRKKEGKIQ